MRLPIRPPRSCRAALSGAGSIGLLLVALFAWSEPRGAACAERREPAEADAAALPWRISSALEYGPLEQQLFEAHAARQLAEGDLPWAALIASGVTDEPAYQAWREHWDAIVARMKRAVPADAAGEVLAATVYRFLHAELLTGGYDIRCSDMTAVLETGRFNCISATLLYNCLAAEVGLKTRAAETPGHVFSLVLLDDRRLEVETTCPAWFEILNDPARLAAFAPPVGDAAGTVGGRQPIRRELGTAELTAIVYYNRGVDFVERRRFAEAVACNHKALQLDGTNSVARGNLLAAINNWSLAEAEQGRFEESLQILRAGRRIAPNHATFAVNFVALHQQWADALTARGRYREAGDILQLAAREAPDEPQLDASRFLIYRQWGERLARAQRYEEMFALFAEGRRREPSHAVQWNQAEVVAVRNAALHLAHSGRAKTALWLIDQAEAKHPRNLALAKTRNEILRQRAAA